MMSRLRTVSINVGSTFLALTLIGLGLVQLINPAVLGAFASWGYPERFGRLVAAVEISGGVFLLVPSVAWYSAALLGVLLAGAISTHLWSGPTQLQLPAVTLFAAVALAGYARHPRTFALDRLRAVADAVAEREIAQQRRRPASHVPPKKGQSPFSELKATSATTRPAGRAAAATKSAAHSSEV